MTVKVTVETEDFTVELPCVMAVKDRKSDMWTKQEINTFDPISSYPWRGDNGGGYQMAKPIPKPKMIPWDHEDFVKAFENLTILKSNEGHRCRIVGYYNGFYHVGMERYTVQEMLEYYKHDDGSELEKEEK